MRNHIKTHFFNNIFCIIHFYYPKSFLMKTIIYVFYKVFWIFMGWAGVVLGG